MAAPVVKVSIKFDGSNWTDVSAYVRLSNALTITAGRADVDSKVTPGRLSGLTLRNNDGRFTVGHTSGAYYPNVRPGKWIKVEVQDPVSTTYVPRFTGRIDGWPLSWKTGGTDCTVTISATDVLGDCLKTVEHGTYVAAVHQAANSGALQGYWPLVTPDSGSQPNDSGVSTNLADSLGAAPPDRTDAGPFGDQRPLPRFGGCTEGWWLGTSGFTMDWPMGASSTYTVSFLWRSTDKTPVNPGVVIQQTSGAAWGMTVDANGWPVLSSWDYLGVHTGTGGDEVDICDGRLWWVLCNYAEVSTGYCNVSVLVYDAATGALEAGVYRNNYAWDNFASPTGIRAGAFPGAVAHVGVWTALDGASVSATLGFRGLDGVEVSVATRLATINALTDLTAGTMTTTGTVRVNMWPSPSGGVTPLDMLHHVEDTEGGMVWATPSGAVQLVASSVLADTTGITVSAADIGPALTVDPSRLRVANDVVAINHNGPLEHSRTALTDATSISIHGRRAASLDVYGDPTSLPYNLVDYRSTEILVTSETRNIPTLPLNVLTMTNSEQAAVLGLSVWQRVNVTDLPTPGGFGATWAGRVQGWSETIGADQWSVTLNTEAV